jgi:hypothetical protein
MTLPSTVVQEPSLTCKLLSKQPITGMLKTTCAEAKCLKTLTSVIIYALDSHSHVLIMQIAHRVIRVVEQ